MAITATFSFSDGSINSGSITVGISWGMYDIPDEDLLQLAGALQTCDLLTDQMPDTIELQSIEVDGIRRQVELPPAE